MKTLNKTLLAATLVSGLSMASSNAMAFPEFTIEEGALAGNGVNEFTADRIIGGYEELVTITSLSAPGAGTFSTSLVWNAGSFSNTNVGPASLPSQLGGFGAGYEMYALFLGTGSFTTDGTGRTNFAFATGTFSLYADLDQDTGFTGTNGTVSYTRSGEGEDELLGSGDFLRGRGNQLCTANNVNDCGSFGTATDFELTALGEAYFIEPNPFYEVSLQSGNFNEIDLTQGVTTDVNGVMNVTFNVPEPASLALMGLGFIGLGFAGRKQAKK